MRECIGYDISFSVFEAEDLILIYYDDMRISASIRYGFSSEIAIEPYFIWDGVYRSICYIEIFPGSIARDEPPMIYDTNLFSISHEKYLISDGLSNIIILYSKNFSLMFIENNTILESPWRYISTIWSEFVIVILVLFGFRCFPFWFFYFFFYWCDFPDFCYKKTSSLINMWPEFLFKNNLKGSWIFVFHCLEYSFIFEEIEWTSWIYHLTTDFEAQERRIEELGLEFRDIFDIFEMPVPGCVSTLE